MSHNLSRLSKTLLVAAMIVAVAHHIDHIMRADHSGWPFVSRVTPFTYSLAVYPGVLFAIVARNISLWVRTAVVGVLTAATLLAHALVETPHMQYAMWAYNESADPHSGSVQNLLNLQSPALGALSVVIGMVLNILAVASTASMIRDAVARAAMPRVIP